MQPDNSLANPNTQNDPKRSGNEGQEEEEYEDQEDEDQEENDENTRLIPKTQLTKTFEDKSQQTDNSLEEQNRIANKQIVDDSLDKITSFNIQEVQVNKFLDIIERNNPGQNSQSIDGFSGIKNAADSAKETSVRDLNEKIKCIIDGKEASYSVADLANNKGELLLKLSRDDLDGFIKAFNEHPETSKTDSDKKKDKAGKVFKTGFTIFGFGMGGLGIVSLVSMIIVAGGGAALIAGPAFPIVMGVLGGVGLIVGIGFLIHKIIKTIKNKKMLESNGHVYKHLLGIKDRIQDIQVAKAHSAEKLRNVYKEPDKENQISAKNVRAEPNPPIVRPANKPVANASAGVNPERKAETTSPVPRKFTEKLQQSRIEQTKTIDEQPKAIPGNPQSHVKKLEHTTSQNPGSNNRLIV